MMAYFSFGKLLLKLNISSKHIYCSGIFFLKVFYYVLWTKSYIFNRYFSYRISQLTQQCLYSSILFSSHFLSFNRYCERVHSLLIIIKFHKHNPLLSISDWISASINILCLSPIPRNLHP